MFTNNTIMKLQSVTSYKNGNEKPIVARVNGDMINLAYWHFEISTKSAVLSVFQLDSKKPLLTNMFR